MTGYGEVCPLGPFDLPAYAEGVRAGLRDLCVTSGIAVTLEDSWGGDSTTAAIAHFPHSTR